MPANVVKTAADEKHWEAAKARVAKEYPHIKPGASNHWALVMSIYQRMKGN